MLKVAFLSPRYSLTALLALVLTCSLSAHASSDTPTDGTSHASTQSASSEPSKDSTIESTTVLTTDSKTDSSTGSTTDYQIHYSFLLQSPIDRLLLEKGELNSTLSRIKRFTQKNFKLNSDITFIFHDSSFNESLSEPEEKAFDKSARKNQNIFVSLSFLYQLNQSLNVRYPQQTDVQAQIYRATLEKLIWQKLAEILLNPYVPAYSKKSVMAFDALSTLFILNQNHIETDYLLDANEAYLSIDYSGIYQSHSDLSEAEAEISLDDERYRRIVCLILGKDYEIRIKEKNEPYLKLLSELSWDLQKIERCHKLYQTQLSDLLFLLAPQLKDNHRLDAWLDLSSTAEGETTEAKSLRSAPLENQ